MIMSTRKKSFKIPKRSAEAENRRTDNTMGKQGQTIQWENKDRQYNGQKRTNNDLQNTTQKTED